MEKCRWCGKFIGYERAHVVMNFTPDTPFGPEIITFEHRNESDCKNKKNDSNKFNRRARIG